MRGGGGTPSPTLLGQVGEQHDQIRAVLKPGFEQGEAHIQEGLAAMVAPASCDRALTSTGWPRRSWPAFKAGWF